MPARLAAVLRRSRRLVVLPAVVGLLALSLVLVTGTREAAQAYAHPPTPVKITPQGIEKVPASTIVGRSPLGRVFQAANLAWTAYQLADSFMNHAEKPDPADPTKTVPGDPVDPLQGTTVDTSGYLQASAQLINQGKGLRVINSVIAPQGGSQALNIMVDYQYCYNVSTFEVVRGGGPQYVATSYPGNNSTAPLIGDFPNLCGDGWRVAQAQVGVTSGTAGRNIIWGAGWGGNGDGTAVPEIVTTETTVQCKDPQTGTVYTITDTENGHPERVPVPSCAERKPGTIPWDVSVKVGTKGTTADGASKPREIYGYSHAADSFSQFADCWGAGGLKCKTKVWISGEACTAGDSACVDWQGYQQDHPDRVECKFGPYVVSMDTCAPLKYAYKTTTTQYVTGTDVNGNPKVTDPQAPANPSTSPSPTVPPTPTQGPNPETPGTVLTPETPADSRSCFGDAWSWNPVDWVYVPVKCALLWAFKPETAVSARIADVQGHLSVKAPFSWIGGFAGLAAAIPGGSCPDWNVKIGSFSRNVVCDSTYTQAIRAARPVLAVFMGALALWPLIRSTAYAAFPIIKPQPGMLR